mmetsp:Transcript_99377/g.264132  ORF Transcript_99377/g.264132 Transcript_99377/m.264132 type:complete len:349 (+) Transcript_99377:294-1340(+)
MGVKSRQRRAGRPRVQGQLRRPVARSVQEQHGQEGLQPLLGRHPLHEGVLRNGGERHQPLDPQGLRARDPAPDHDAGAGERGGRPLTGAGPAPARGAGGRSAGQRQRRLLDGHGGLLEGVRLGRAPVPGPAGEGLLERRLPLPPGVRRRRPPAPGRRSVARGGRHEGHRPRGPRVRDRGDPRQRGLPGPEPRHVRRPQGPARGRAPEPGADGLGGRAPAGPGHLLRVGHEAPLQQQRAAPALGPDGRHVRAEVHRGRGRAEHPGGRHGHPGVDLPATPDEVVPMEMPAEHSCCGRARAAAAGLRQAADGHALVVEVRAGRPAQAAVRGRRGGEDRLQPLRGERLLLRH